MALHIIIGFRGTAPHPVYVGEDAEAARQARESDTDSERHECFHNPLGLRKANPNCVKAPEPKAKPAKKNLA